MNNLNRIVKAIGSFVLAALLFACPIITAFILKYIGINFFSVCLLIICLGEFITLVLLININSEEV